MIKYEIGYPINWRTQDYGTIEDYEKKPLRLRARQPICFHIQKRFEKSN